MFKSIAFLILSFIVSIAGQAQEISVRGSFHQHKARIGEPVPYSLVARHPSTQLVVFPDSSFSFSPFELENKKYFPTHTTNGVSVDSAIYYLTTYEIDSIQFLELPVFAVNRVDCTAVYSGIDTLFISTVVKAMPESVEAKDLPLKTNADYINVRWMLNYPVLLIIGGVLLVILLVIWIIFGKRIRRYFLLRRLTKNHAAFLARFNKYVENVRAGAAYSDAESALVDWKKYMESLLATPYTKYTTKEILNMVSDEALGNALHDIDRMVYARSGSSPEAFERLQAYSQDQFNRRTKEVMHG